MSDVGVYSPVNVTNVYDMPRLSALDPTPTARTYTEGQELTDYESKKGILVVRYADGTSEFVKLNKFDNDDKF